MPPEYGNQREEDEKRQKAEADKNSIFDIAEPLPKSIRASCDSCSCLIWHRGRLRSIPCPAQRPRHARERLESEAGQEAGKCMRFCGSWCCAQMEGRVFLSPCTGDGEHYIYNVGPPGNNHYRMVGLEAARNLKSKVVLYFHRRSCIQVL